jgi:hypothetical protein
MTFLQNPNEPFLLLPSLSYPPSDFLYCSEARHFSRLLTQQQQAEAPVLLPCSL